MEHDNNRSSALSPEHLAVINSTVSAAVSEAVSSVFSALLPALKDMQLTPEKIALMKAPYVDPKALARELRESAQTKEQEAESRRMLKAMQDNCLHVDKNGKPAICLIHNYPDHNPRGICPHCFALIEPKHWVIDAPDPVTGKTNARLEGAHKDYKTVLQIESTD